MAIRCIVFLLVLTCMSCINALENESQELLFFGDSHIEYWDVNYHFPAKKTSNFGVAGDRIDNTLEILQSTSIENDALVVLEVGTNDMIGLLNASLTTEEKIDSVMQQYDELLILLANYRTYMIEVFPLSENFNEQNTAEEYTKLNAALKSRIDNFPSITLIETNQYLNTEAGDLDKQYLTDEVHLNNLGYDILSNLVRNEIF